MLWLVIFWVINLIIFNFLGVNFMFWCILIVGLLLKLELWCLIRWEVCLREDFIWVISFLGLNGLIM